MPTAVTCWPWPRAPGRRYRRPDPVTVTARYLWPGRRAASASLPRSSAGRRFDAGTATMVSMPPAAGRAGTSVICRRPRVQPVEGALPAAPAGSACIRIQRPSPPPFMDRVDLRLDPTTPPCHRVSNPGVPLMRGSFRLPGGEPVGSLALLCAVDAFPPTAFNAAASPGRRRSSSPLISGPTRRPAGFAAAFRPVRHRRFPRGRRRALGQHRAPGWPVA